MYAEPTKAIYDKDFRWPKAGLRTSARGLYLYASNFFLPVINLSMTPSGVEPKKLPAPAMTR